jgi:hypothetical protein
MPQHLQAEVQAIHYSSMAKCKGNLELSSITSKVRGKHTAPRSWQPGHLLHAIETITVMCHVPES